MPRIRTFSALAFILMLVWPVTALAQLTPIQGPPPVTFEVHVKISNLLPEVDTFSVVCDLRQGTLVNIAQGGSSQSVPDSGNVDGIITVYINKLFVNKTILDLAQADRFYCRFETIHAGGSNGGFAYPPGDTAHPWALPKPGTNFVSEIQGPFPPPAPGTQSPGQQAR